MLVKYITVFLSLKIALAIYPYFDTQDFIYNVPKVYRISITLDKLLAYYEKKPSKDPEWYISLGLARGQLEYTINELDKSVPPKLKENLQNLTRKMDRIHNNTDITKLIYRSKDYEYVAKAIFENLDVLSSIMEPITLGTMGTQKPYRFDFEQYVQEARTKMPGRKAADACTMQLLISAMETQTTQSDGSCELSPECSQQIMKGSGLAFQQTSRLRAATLARLFDCMDGVDLNAHIYKLCIQIYKETKSLEAWDHPAGTKTIFMQQTNCKMSGIIPGNINNVVTILRTPEIEGVCIFPACPGNDMGEVPNILKINLLCKFNFLISSGTSVCRQHCTAGEEEWAIVMESPNNCTDFNNSHAQSISDLLRFSLEMINVMYCALHGYGEFIKPRWMNKIMSWQEPRGCYSDDRQPFMRLTGFVTAAPPAPKEREEEYRVKKAADSEGGACNSLTSAMALGSMVIYIRALLETDHAFQYDVLD